MKSKFTTKTGLSGYALLCGYIQRAELGDIRVDLFAEGACFHTRTYNYSSGTRRWESFDSLAHARTVFNRMCSQAFAAEFKWFRGDRRYTIHREWCGEEEPWWIARFCGDWVAKADNPQQAKLHCFKHNQERMS